MEYLDFNDQAGWSIEGSRHAVHELKRALRVLRLLHQCDEAIMRAEDETALISRICTLIVESGNYAMAMTAFAQNDAACSLVPIAYAGRQAADYCCDLQLSWSASHPAGQGPTGQTIRTGKPAVVVDIARVTEDSPCLETAYQLGLRGVITLPLSNGKQCFGVFALYAETPIAPLATEMQLLQKLAADLAFGIESVRAKKLRQRLQAGAMNIAAAVSAPPGEHFFSQLVGGIVDALDARAAFVARWSPERPNVLRTIAAATADRSLDNFIYTVEAGTDAARSNCLDLFPGPDVLSFLDAKVCLGRSLFDSSGRRIGLLVVLFNRPTEDSGFMASGLQIFAARAAAELEREDSVGRIREQAALLDKARDAIVVRDIDNRVRFWNKGAERLFGWSSEEALGHSIEELLYEDPATLREATRTVLEKGEWHGEITERHKDGKLLIVEGNWTLVRDEKGVPQSIFAIKTDITARKAAEQEIQQLAFYDPLTRLPNRRMLLDRLKQALAASARTQKCGALLFIDLDNFKTLNDTLGHDTGDMLLQQVAARLVSCVRASDTVARLGGDEFVIMLEEIGDELWEATEHAEKTGEKILAAFASHFHLNEHKHCCTPSIGATLFGCTPASVEELLKQADVAMYEAKAAGRNGIRFFGRCEQRYIH
ncbi:MAG: diguanylate cyclase [Burkholderiales bacterium]|nr:diguanylate cyclase [Burkholderiales bacterium]